MTPAPSGERGPANVENPAGTDHIPRVTTQGTILIVDDDPVTLQILGASLRQHGYRVITAMDATQGLMAARRNTPDAILLDMMLPGGGGRVALRQLKSNSQTQMIPVVAISGSNEPGMSGELTALGAEGFLPKPVDLAQLTTFVHRLLHPSGPAAESPS
jgi:CheY-like chemotaxis protein